MLSLILLCHDLRPAPEAAVSSALIRERAARSLASLVEASIAGVIADATLVAAVDAVAFGGLKTARTLKAAPESLLTRLAPSLARPVGLLARKNAISEAGGAEVARLARTLKAREMVSRARRGA